MRTMASVPFGCRYRLIDFTLSNMVNSGIGHVGVITHYNYQSLMDHLGSGKDWDLARRSGGIQILPPYITAFASSRPSLYSTRMEALIGVLPFIRGAKEDYVVLSDCDVICNIDFSDMIKKHVDSGADCTIAVRHSYVVPRSGTSNNVVLSYDSDGNVTDIAENMDSQPSYRNVNLNMYVMRRKYLEADMGITGANFIVARDGMISVTENEGNSRLSAAMPKIHLVLVGIEKVVPRLEDLALFLPMLATAGAGQPLTGYNTQYAGPRTAENPDGPEQFHVVLLDNNRTALLADAEHRDALHCMRCGACLNVCPVFKNIGGLSYGTTYQGPIGSLITPHLRGTKNWQHLSYSSSLCGACTQACPVKIDIHEHLLENRRNATRLSPSPLWRLIFFGFNFVFSRPKLYALAGKLARASGPLAKLAGKIPGTLLYGWTGTRDLPPPPKRSFRERFKEESKN